MAQHNELGKKGQELAVQFLIENGYTILERNYRFNKAEVDIIALQNDILAIVEVKTRSSLDFGNPESFLKPRQIQNLVKAVNYYVETSNLDVEIRFDIISILKENGNYTLKLIKNAFFHF
ncbi:YraN family protein [Aurantibacter aestuarii]|uniref:UPF0102 protein C7H52_02545 n=1 Tax=Aurantibacter aestuarii TaxID=1266046 RepID=A0A2T1NCK9_9FLAO|nr:YraN family protein [Aurantibacter aestuarii]PSG90175.1 endonuclease [Aurantibacter aestuarii]